MAKLIDLTNQKFGKLTAIKRAEDYIKPSGAKMVRWECKCDCGNTIVVRGDHLRNGTTKSCGCSRKEANKKVNMEVSQREDQKYIGKTFGDLTVLQRIENQGTNVRYRCKCQCGNIIGVNRADLKSGKRTHCGCKKIEATHYKDIAGQRFGKLVALYPTKKNERRAMMWMFQCDCGNQKEIEGNSVTRGNTLSCGCLKQSHGELLIEQLLIKHNIPYEKEVSLFDYAPNSHARFDFYINKKYVIEFDGEQHFKSNDRWWNTEKLVNKQQKYDQKKNQWCKENNIPIIRIPYTHLKQLCIEDLILDSSHFILP